MLNGGPITALVAVAANCDPIVPEHFWITVQTLLAGVTPDEDCALAHLYSIGLAEA